MRILLAIVCFIGLLSIACGNDNRSATQKANDINKQSIQARGEVIAAANDLAPLPRPRNFPLRKALVEYTNRQDLINHPWYIYIQGQNGNTIGYFVGKTYPISTCDFLSSTAIITDGGNERGTGTGNVVIPAPSLDGIYYGGSGAQGGCDYFFFDAATDAMQVISHNQFWFVSDQPLALNVQPIKVQGQ